MYEYLIQDEHGKIVYVTEDRIHAKLLADVMQDKTGRPYFVDCMLATLCDHIPLPKSPESIPEQRLDPY